MPTYGYALGEEAVLSFTTLSSRRRERLLRVDDRLANHPGQSGDYREPGVADRRYEVALFDDVLLTWWVDHAAREVRIVRIEQID